MIKAVTFDCWDTILVDDPAIMDQQNEYFLSLFEGKGLYLTHAEMYNIFLDEEKIFHRHVLKNMETPDAQMRVETIVALSKLNFSGVEKAEAAAYCDAIALDFLPPPVPGIKSVLDELSQNYNLGLICNTGWHSGRVVRKLLERYHLLNYFSQLSFSDEIGHAKPHKKIFEQTLEELGCPAENCVHIGDSEDTDIRGAKALGMKAVLFAPPNSGNGIHSKADIRIDNFRNLVQLIGKM